MDHLRNRACNASYFEVIRSSAFELPYLNNSKLQMFINFCKVCDFGFTFSDFEVKSDDLSNCPNNE